MQTQNVNVKTAASESRKTGEIPAGARYQAGQCVMGVTITTHEADSLNQYDIDIANPSYSPETRSYLIQNKREYIGLMAGIEIVRVG
ncbi:hypothetical protein [Nissabacter archeti]|uniref:hypothetical protein n=1 Tax=Nissabacter archeti TaxID=1917880 RepID=UPI0009321A6A|nr:hypothetical protein [Nissabacter archeti]